MQNSNYQEHLVQEQFVNSEIQRVIDGIREIRRNANLTVGTPYFDEWEKKFGVQREQ